MIDILQTKFDRFFNECVKRDEHFMVKPNGESYYKGNLSGAKKLTLVLLIFLFTQFSTVFAEDSNANSSTASQSTLNSSTINSSTLIKQTAKAPTEPTSNTKQVVLKSLIRDNIKYSSDVIEQFVLQNGSAFSEDDLENSIKQIIINLKPFNVYVDKSFTKDGVVLVYHVLDAPVINKITVGSATKEQESYIKTAIDLKEGVRIDDYNMTMAIAKMYKYYHDKGFYDASIKYSFDDNLNGTIDVNFQVNVGEKAKIYNIRFYGHRKFSAFELKEHIQSNERKFWSFVSKSGTLDDAKRLFDRQMLIKFYKDHGYLDIVVDNGKVYPKKDGQLDLIFNLVEGKEYHFGTISFDGNQNISTENLTALLDIKEGDVFNWSQFQNNVRQLEIAFEDLGHANVSVDYDLKNNGIDKLDIAFHITEGSVYNLTRINFQGSEISYDRIERRQFDIYEQMQYQYTPLDEGMDNLAQTTFYENLTQSKKLNNENYTVDYNVSMTDAAGGSFQAAITYSNIGSWGSMGNVAKNNLDGLGYKISLSYNIDKMTTEYSLDFMNPMWYDSKYSYWFGLNRATTSYDTYDKASTGGSFHVGRDLYKRKLYVSVGLNYQITNINHITADKGSRIWDYEGKRERRSGDVSVYWSTLDNGFNPNTGAKYSVTYESVGGLFGGQVTYDNVEFLAERFKWIVEDHVNSLIKFTAGNKFVSRKHTDIPVDELYTLGGLKSVRGYEYGTIGTKDKQDNVIGNSKYVLLNTELIFPLDYNYLSVFTYVDAGQTFDTISSGKLMDKYGDRQPRATTGIGLRWVTYMGVVNFQYGQKLNKARDDQEASRFDFSIGGIF